MNLNETIAAMGHEQLVFCHDAAATFHGLIAIHSTKLGPAVGGTRFWSYLNEEQAIVDALRLSRGMTYKNALAGLPFGGGKAVIMADPSTAPRERIFRTLGRFVERLGGRFITAEDVGTNPADMAYVRLETSYVAGLAGRSGDPSPWTALGVFRAIQAAAKHRWRSENLAGKIVALQGCGNVGYQLARELHQAGARLLVTDTQAQRVQVTVHDFGAQAVAPDEIYRVAADIFAPCALGGVLNDQTIPQLQAQIVAGAANNQLLEPRHGERLKERDVTYVPDYVANAGGVINGCREMLGWESAQALQRINAIHETTLAVLQMAAAEDLATNQAADRLAERRLLS
ncbi:MAG: Glu/Leu/Phe/Val dehydrogenase dimerization domain-containing protein [bacterium]